MSLRLLTLLSAVLASFSGRVSLPVATPGLHPTLCQVQWQQTCSRIRLAWLGVQPHLRNDNSGQGAGVH